MRFIFSTYRILLILLMLTVCVGSSAIGRYANSSVESDTLRGGLYMKLNLDIERRNILMAFVPRLYEIYDGARFYVTESYGDFSYVKEKDEFTYHELLRASTVRHQRRVFPNLMDYVEPQLHGETLFNGHILSPFHKKNRRFYKYHTIGKGDMTYLFFRPRVHNSTLTNGNAIIDTETHKIINAHLNGDSDHFRYAVDITMDTLKDIPRLCRLGSGFNFLGNKINATITARYGNNVMQTSDSTTSDYFGRMQSVRSQPLSQRERGAYAEVYVHEDSTETESVPQGKLRRMMDNLGATAYKYLIRRPSYRNSNGHVSMSPVLDPFAIGYSGHTGISYRIKLWGGLTFGDNRDLSLAPHLGYNFRQRQFYISAPLRYTFNRRKGGWLEMYVANGRHISSGRLLEKIKDIDKRDTIAWEHLNIDYFRDLQVSLKSNIPLGRHFHIGAGAVYHRRMALNPDKLVELGQRTIYRSFAPSLRFIYRPSDYVSYQLNYERGIPHVLNGDSNYERMEFDSQFAVRYNRLSSLNFRFGAGGYTKMDTDNVFVDYEMFAENYLPDTWNDDWTGRFFLLSSDLYNASKYYVRSNVSYESPLLALAYVPVLGYYVEKERMYISNLFLQKTSPYTEIGYAFTTRYFSFGLFTGFFAKRFNEVGTKISIELFKKW